MTAWRAQPGPQLDAIRRDTIDELLFGGAVFGGKSDFLLGDFGQDVPRAYGPHWHGILFRKTYSELEQLIERSKQIYPPWFDLSSSAWSVGNKMWTWPNGATLKMRYLESDDDWQQYWGHDYTWIGWDEIGLYASDTPYLRMKGRLRSAQANIPNKRIRASANPGGAGHHWVKRYWGIDQHPLGGVVFDPDDGSGMRRAFIRSRVTDNKIGLANDPGYLNRLNGLGSPQLVKMWKEGDWNTVAGAYFPEFSMLRHVIEPFKIPEHWLRFRAMDWGSSDPFSVGWYAVSDGKTEIPWAGDHSGRLVIPRMALVKYREWYGATPDGKGLKLTAEEIAKGILERERHDPHARAMRGYLDPSAFSVNGGPSLAERMWDCGARFDKANNKRVGQKAAMGGWDKLRADLKGDESGRPMIYFFATCPDTVRTLPALQHSTSNPEDADTHGEDHAPDETRYAAMSRPWVRDVAPDQVFPRFWNQATANEVFWEDGKIGVAANDSDPRWL